MHPEHEITSDPKRYFVQDNINTKKLETPKDRSSISSYDTNIHLYIDGYRI